MPSTNNNNNTTGNDNNNQSTTDPNSQTSLNFIERFINSHDLITLISHIIITISFVCTIA